MSQKKKLSDFVKAEVAVFPPDEEILAREKQRIREETDIRNRKNLLEFIGSKRLFLGDGGFGPNLSKENLKSLLSEVLTALEEDAEKIRQHKKEKAERFYRHYHSTYDEPPETGLYWEESHALMRLVHLECAAKEGIVLADWKERLKLVYDDIHDFPRRGNDRSAQWRLEEQDEKIQKVASLLARASGELSEQNFEGLQFVPFFRGERKEVYLNGEFITSVGKKESFGASPFGNGVVAWLFKEQIDHCPIKGAQQRWIIYAWKSGFEQPKQVFEDHAYDAERSLRVSAPEVDQTGKISFTVYNNNKSAKKEIMI